MFGGSSLNHRFKNFLYTILFLTTLLTIVFTLSIYYGEPKPLVLKYRFTRSLSVVLTGFIIGVSGSLLQGCLRNPLVDQYILGIGTGSLFLVYISILIYGYSLAITPLFAIIGGLTALALTLIIGDYIGGSDTAYVLSGLGVNSLFAGLSIILVNILSTRYPYIVSLYMGSFTRALPEHHTVLLILVLINIISYIILAKPLNTIVLGDQYSLQLGYNPYSYRRLTLLVAGVSSSITVSIYGLIGFIGLITPHISRLLVKTIDHRFTIPLSGLTGSLILLITDCFTRLVLVDITGEIPTGALVSSIGAPFFIILVLKRFKRI